MLSRGGIEPVCLQHRQKDFRSGIFTQLYKTSGLGQFPLPQVAVSRREQGENQHTAFYIPPPAMFTRFGSRIIADLRTLIASSDLRKPLVVATGSFLSLSEMDARSTNADIR